MSRIIDAHMHYRPENGHFSNLAKACGHSNDERGIAASFTALGIMRGIIMGNGGMEMDDHRYPALFSYLIGLHDQQLTPETLDGSVALAEEHLRLERCVGIKIYAGYTRHYLADDVYQPFYELARRYAKPVAVHMGVTVTSRARLRYSHPLNLDDAAAMHPEVRFVMCHFGNPWLADSAAVLEKNDNVCADLSGLLTGDFDLDEYMERQRDYVSHLRMWIAYVENYEKFMYGTDWPLVNMRNYARFIERLIPEKHLDQVFFSNANRIYGLGL